MATLLKQKKCPVCSSSRGNEKIVFDHFVKCSKCGSLEMVDKPAVSYEQEYYGRGKTGRIMKIIDMFSFWDRYRNLHLLPSDKILEIGFGEGKFLKELRTRDYQVYGMERSEFSRINVQKYIGNDKVFADIGEIKSKFDVVLLFQVLEHIEKPKQYIESLKNILTPNGRLIVRVPNINSWEANLAGKDWYHLDYPHHPIVFTDKGISKMFVDAGYRDIKIRRNMGEYRQVMGYSILSYLRIKLPVWAMVVYQIITIPILWIFLGLVAQHGVVEVEGRAGNSKNNT